MLFRVLCWGNGGKKESLRMTPQGGPAAALAAALAAAFAAPVYCDSRSVAHPEGSKLKEATCQITILYDSDSIH